MREGERKSVREGERQTERESERERQRGTSTGSDEVADDGIHGRHLRAGSAFSVCGLGFFLFFITLEPTVE